MDETARHEFLGAEMLNRRALEYYRLDQIEKFEVKLSIYLFFTN